MGDCILQGLLGERCCGLLRGCEAPGPGCQFGQEIHDLGVAICSWTMIDRASRAQSKFEFPSLPRPTHVKVERVSGQTLALVTLPSDLPSICNPVKSRGNDSEAIRKYVSRSASIKHAGGSAILGQPRHHISNRGCPIPGDGSSMRRLCPREYPFWHHPFG